MNAQKAFTVTDLFFGILSAGLAPEIFTALQDDSLGLRQRLAVNFCGAGAAKDF